MRSPQKPSQSQFPREITSCRAKALINCTFVSPEKGKAREEEEIAARVGKACGVMGALLARGREVIWEVEKEQREGREGGCWSGSWTAAMAVSCGEGEKGTRSRRVREEGKAATD
jgi:hypothetical protein